MKFIRPFFLFVLLALAPSLRAAVMGTQEPAGYTSRIEGRFRDKVYASATDAAGNVYVVGLSFSAAAGFPSEMQIDVFRDRGDDNTGRPGLSSNDALLTGFGDAFIIKYDRDGNVVWKRSAGNSGTATIATGVAVDATGNVFVSGSFGGTATFGNLTVTAAARSNANIANTLAPAQVTLSNNTFIAMIDRDGIWQWARQFEFAVYPSTDTSVANLGGEALVTSASIDTDTGGSFTAAGTNQGRSLALDAQGNLYLKMRLNGFAASPAANRVLWLRTAGAGRVAALSTNGSGTATGYGGTPFVAKLAATPPPLGSPAGTPTTYDWRWVAPVCSGVLYDGAGTITSVVGTFDFTTFPVGAINDIAVDNNDSLYLCGDWRGNLVAGGAQRLPFTTSPGTDGFVARWRSLDAAPLYLATYSAGVASGGNTKCGAFVLDEDRNVYVTGFINNATQVRRVSQSGGIGTGTVSAGAASRTSFFVGKINPAGEWLWSEAPTITTGTTYRVTATTLVRDVAGGLYIGGSITDSTTATFAPGVTVSGQSTFQTQAGTIDSFLVKLTENTDTNTRTWQWGLNTNAQHASLAPKFDTTSLLAGNGGTVYWLISALNNANNGRFAASRSPNTADRDFDTSTAAGCFLLPVLTDTPALSPQFSIITTILSGQEVVPPAGVFRDANGRTLQPDITLPFAGGANGATHFHWDPFEKKLYALDPQLADIRWKVTDDALNTRRIVRRVQTVWPTPAQGLITHVTGAGPNGDEPKVPLESPAVSFNHTFSSILYQDSNASLSAKTFSAKASGYSILLYTVGKNTAFGSAPVSLEVVRSFLWTDPAVNTTDTAAVGTEISGSPYNHGDPTGKNGYLVNAKARFDGTGAGAAHDRATQLGPIIPVNRDETTTTEDDMVIVWSNINPRGVAWPAKVVTYDVIWPLSSQIVIASRLGSDTPGPVTDEPLDPAKFQAMSIYHQPDKSLAGYNPNEEHALLAPSNGVSAFQAVFALRSDLNNLGRTTSQPFALLRYQDSTDGLKTKFKVYQVVAERTGVVGFPSYVFSAFTGTAGTRVQAPYPLLLLGDAAGTTGSGAAYFKDRKNQVWAKSAGSITARYFYPLQPNFWYDTDGNGVQDAIAEVPWLDRLVGGIIGTPKAVNYTIAWPPSVPTLAVGDTLTTARAGLPDVEAMASATVIYEEANPTLSGASGSVRFIDYTTERKVALNGTINGQNFVLGSRSLAVELVAGGRYRFRDLPFHLKSRLTFDPINKQLIFAGYKEVPAAAAPLLLLNVMSTRERDRLQAIYGAPPNTLWNSAIDVLYSLSRNPNGVTGANVGDYYVGLKGSDTALTYADALGPKALTAGKATGLGYVTLVENNAAGLGAAPIALHILRVVNPPVVGEIKLILSDNALDEKVTLRHANDFAGDPDGLNFEWWYQPAITSTSPPAPVNPSAEGWISLASGAGVNDVIIEGAGLRTLSDSWVFCRYRGYSAGGNNPLTFTDWAGDPSSTPLDRRAQLVPGWIKRVLEGINAFEARVKDFGSAPTQTYSSFVAQAGTRFEGSVALSNDPAYINSLGLIPLYETVLRRGFSLSIDGTPAQTNDAVNSALLLASTRISDLYTLLGHEAYADAQDPTIGFTSADGEVGSLAPSVFSFANQLPSLIDEELALLRGRDNSAAGTGAAPVYNRLFWNFTNGLEGEPVYVQNYGVVDQNADGFITETDAAKLFPQGHGDAWGHYLTAVTGAYRLLRHPGFTWIPRPEPTTVGGVAIEVDYLDERKFANAAAARATCGAEIVNLTYRDRYVADPAGQWQGYRDTDTARAWGVDEWARRAGQGAYFDWLTANAILPAVHTAPLSNPGGPAPTGLQKIDRTTVPELTKIATAFDKIQTQMDQADRGLNPLGVTPGTVPFDIDPAFLIIGSGIQGTKHFEQIYERTIAAVNGARRIFDHANELTQRLRQTQISSDAFAQDVRDQENDFRSRLIEIFGYPYAGDIGSGKTYPTGYIGPDIYHYNYVAVTEVSGRTVQPDTSLRGFFKPFAQDYPTPPVAATQPGDFQQVVRHYFTNDVADPTVSNNAILQVDFPLALGATASRWAFAAPTSWGQRRAPGALQLAISDMVRAEAELRRGKLDYENHIKSITDELDLLRARFNVQNSQITVLNKQRNELRSMTATIGVLQGVARGTELTSKVTENLGKAANEFIPKIIGLASDVFFGLRGASAITVGAARAALDAATATADTTANAIDLAKEDVALRTEIEIQKSGFTFEVQEHLKAIEALLREEVGLRLDLFNLQQSLLDAAGNYQKTLAEGQELMEERKRFRQRVAGAVQQNRYQDLTFRLFRNEALQKYRASFDLAARYVYMAATTYDYETCQLGSKAAAGRRFLTDIVRERALGQYLDDEPVPGVNGLSDPLGRLNQNFQVLKTQLGINNPQIESNRFSLRRECFRIREDSDDEWRTLLQKFRVADLWQVPEFRRFCRPFAPESAGAQPGLVIPFSTDVTFGQNYFGLPLGGGDGSYDSTNFSTKINAVGVWFGNYNPAGLSTTPRVYLVPVGLDIMRAPDDVTLSTREFDVVDQAIPVPFPIGASDLTNPSWIPSDNLESPIGEIRRFGRFRAYHDDGFELGDFTKDSRLVGRSVWNTKWMLIIPGGTFLNDPNAGLDTFISGPLIPGGQTRDGNGNTDIQFLFETYGYSGN